jgi:signal peptidase I
MPVQEIHHEKKSSIVVDILKFTVIAFLIVTPFRYFVAQPFIVSGASMEPTFDAKEYLVIDELSYRFQKPERGDVVVFRYPLDPSTYFIKRVIGLPGEVVVMNDGAISVQKNNTEVFTELREPYLSSLYFKKDSSTTTLTETEYFVLGDNRRASSDSRVWGPLQEKFIIGRAFARLLPLQNIELLPGHFSFEENQSENE